jgi:hypothetical protein
LKIPSLLLDDSASMLEINKKVIQTFDIELVFATMFVDGSIDFATEVWIDERPWVGGCQKWKSIQCLTGSPSSHRFASFHYTAEYQGQGLFNAITT